MAFLSGMGAEDGAAEVPMLWKTVMPTIASRARKHGFWQTVLTPPVPCELSPCSTDTSGR